MDHSSQDGFVEGRKIGAQRYTLIRQLGKGGMGVVWLAHDVSLNEELALKFLPPEIQHDPDALDDMRRETQKSRRLTHPNIIRIHDFVHFQGETPFISMEFVDGSPLNQLKARQPNRLFAWSYVAPLVQQMCEALEYAHSEGVIHRDLKPGNMMVDKKGRLKLADFGIAAQVNETMGRVSVKHTSSGTPTYMSPQQMNGQMPRVTDDIYALGATIYELLTSKPPFFSGNILHQVENVEATPMDQRLQEFGLSNDIPPTVGAVVMACLAKDPAKRPQNMAAVSDRLGFASRSRQATPAFPDVGSAVALDLPGDTKPIEVSATTRAETAGSKRRTGLWAGIGVSGILVLALSIWGLFGRKTDTTARPAVSGPENGSAISATGEKSKSAPQASTGYPQPREWIDATEEARDRLQRAGTLKTDGEWFESTAPNDYPRIGHTRSFTNVAVRIIFSRTVAVKLRSTKDTSYMAQISSDAATILYSGTPLAGWVKFGGDYVSNQAHELVFAALGTQLSLWLDGKLVTSSTDARLTSGNLELVLYDGGKAYSPRIKKVEYGELVPMTAGERWQDWQPQVWKDVTESVKSTGVKAGTLKLEGDWLVLTGIKPHYSNLLPGENPRDIAVKIIFWRTASISVRDSTKGSYNAIVTGKKAGIHYHNAAGELTVLKEIDLGANFNPVAAHEMLFAVQGDRLSLWVDGKGDSITDGTLQSGVAKLVLFPGTDDKQPRIKKVEYGELTSTPQTTNAVAPPFVKQWVDATGKATVRHAIQSLSSTAFTDVVLRARFKGSSGIQLFLREQNQMLYRLVVNEGGVSLHLLSKDEKRADKLMTPVSVPPLGQTNEHEVIFAAQRNTLSVWLDAKPVWSGTDTKLDRGTLAYYLADDVTLFKLEYGEPATPTAGDHWQDWKADQQRGGKVPTGFKAEGNAWISRTDAEAVLSPSLQNGAIRATFTLPDKLLSGASIRLRKTNDDSRYHCIVARDGPRIVISLDLYKQNNRQQLKFWYAPAEVLPTNELQFEARLVGDTFTFTLNGSLIGTFRDATLAQTGGAVFNCHNAGTKVSRIEFLNLDGVTPVTADNTANKKK